LVSIYTAFNCSRRATLSIATRFTGILAEGGQPAVAGLAEIGGDFVGGPFSTTAIMLGHNHSFVCCNPLRIRVSSGFGSADSSAA
jgi:hypothetical protein